ncbi:hypothetical protein GCM10027589_43930 [Actinocorallia lasiicapitis]
MTGWRKSSYSNTTGGDCVEVAKIVGTIGLRDSKTPERPHLTFTPAPFAQLVTRLKSS